MTDINLNEVGCIKPIANIGSTIYRNICTGVDVTTPWGTLDWVGAGLLTTMALVLLALVGLVAWVIFNDLR